MTELSGVCVPVCTLFNDDDETIDERGYLRHIDRMIETKTDIILACGGTGEFAYLTTEEKRRLVEITGKHIENRASFIAQTSAISLRDTIDATKHAADHGADALMILPPYFEGPDAAGVYHHFEKVAEATDLPIMVYNIPVHSGFDITPDFFSKLLEIDNIKYIKDSTGDLIRIQELLQTSGKVFNGGDPITYPALAAGCVGCVWGAINFIPEEAVELYALVEEGKLGEANQLWQRLLPSQLFIWTHVYNSAVKSAANYRGFNVGQCRAPVLPLSNQDLSILTHNLDQIG
jgi:4-hydroxy-tetrahydrodipicolinate synthase